MRKIDQDIFTLSVNDLKIIASIVPWDTEVFSFPVVSIDLLEMANPKKAIEPFKIFEDWLDKKSIKLVSCRLDHQNINASIFLQDMGFRFIEMVLHPKLSDLQSIKNLDQTYQVSEVTEGELSGISSMAQKVFGHERYHVDPKIDSNAANLRYARWVNNSFSDSRQSLLKITSDKDILGFFITENKGDRLAYWHLTALNPEYIGHRIGPDVWKSMILHHKSEGINNILTTISAGNIPALNLYSKLNFRFAPPEVTFHWHRSHI